MSEELEAITEPVGEPQAPEPTQPKQFDWTSFLGPPKLPANVAATSPDISPEQVEEIFKAEPEAKRKPGRPRNTPNKPKTSVEEALTSLGGHEPSSKPFQVGVGTATGTNQAGSTQTLPQPSEGAFLIALGIKKLIQEIKESFSTA